MPIELMRLSKPQSTLSCPSATVCWFWIRHVLGFYSVAPASLTFERLPENVQRGLAQHEVPGFRLARLAIHHSVRGQGLGGQLLFAAARRCILVAKQVGGMLLAIDAKDDSVAAWHGRYGAFSLADNKRSLVLPLTRLETELRVAGKL